MRRADNIDAIVGDNLRALRTSRDMSQGQLAKALGISFQQIQKYEKGKNRISAGNLYRIAKAFHVPIASLYNGLRTPAGDGESPVRLVTRRDASKLMTAFDQVEERPMRYAIVTLVKQLAQKKSKK